MKESDLKNLVPGSSLYDDAVPGLHLRVFVSKSCYYYYYRTAAGVQRRPKLGDSRIISLAQARQLARAMALKILNGNDPSQEKQALKLSMSVAQLFEQCYDTHWNQEKYIKSKWAREVKNLYTRNIDKTFGKKKINELTRAAVKIWHQNIGKRSVYEANRSLGVLTKLYSWVEDLGLDTQNPTKGVKPFEERKRTRLATPEEMARIGIILKREAVKFPRQSFFIFLLMYTGARPSAIERATWADVEVFGNYAKITMKGKTGWEEMIIPPQALALLSNVTQTPTLTGIKYPRSFWERVRKEAGCTDLWVRDWRRTFASVALSNGESISAIGELLNHKSAQTTKRYAKLLDPARVRIAGDIATSIERLING